MSPTEASKRIANVTWIVRAVRAGRGHLNLAYCCRGQGVFMVALSGRDAGIYNLYPFIINDVWEEKGGCEFARICLVFSCPLNKATYEDIAREYRIKTEDVEKTLKMIRETFEKLVEGVPELKNMLCQGTKPYAVMFEHAPIRLRRVRSGDRP